MNRSRASMVLATFVAMMAMVVGAVALTSVAASAKPPPKYPPATPRCEVNHGSVHQDSSVRASGSRYTSRERVYVTITYPAVGHRRPVIKTIIVNASRSGRFSVNVRLTGLGRVLIRARGARSHVPATAVVVVTKNRGHRNNHPVAFVDTAGSIGLSSTSAALHAA
jgi:hypothetical protein